MAARPAEAAAPSARQQGSETFPDGPPLSPRTSAPAPHHGGESHQQKATTRKRAASINTEEANRPQVEKLSINAAPSSESPRPFDAGGGLICLCTPEPKVPRPRNGMFWLFLLLLLQYAC